MPFICPNDPMPQPMRRGVRRRARALAAAISAMMATAVVANPPGREARNAAGLVRGLDRAALADYGVVSVDLAAAGAVAERTLPRRLVLLIHGLGARSGVWHDVRPALVDEGHAVACFEYANNERAARAADRLAVALRHLRASGVETVDVVAHSMGGLIVRDILGRPELYASDGRGTFELPTIDHVVMLGTPNAGAPLAHLARVPRLRDRIVGALPKRSGDEPARGIGVPAGDLVPGSSYLRRLDGYPIPSHTEFTIVAGRVAPPAAVPIEHCLRSVCGGRTPRWLLRLARRTAACVDQFLGSIGDGVVSVESARWSAVDDFIVVEAGHLGMLMGEPESSEQISAVPIILDRLDR